MLSRSCAHTHSLNSVSLVVRERTIESQSVLSLSLALTCAGLALFVSVFCSCVSVCVCVCVCCGLFGFLAWRVVSVAQFKLNFHCERLRRRLLVLSPHTLTLTPAKGLPHRLTDTHTLSLSLTLLSVPACVCACILSTAEAKAQSSAALSVPSRTEPCSAVCRVQ